MTKKLLILSILLIGLFVLVVSCQRDEEREGPTGEPSGYSDTESTAEFMARAQQFFEATYSPEVKSRTAQYQPDAAYLSSLEVFPDWERSRMSSDEGTACLEFPLISDKPLGVAIGGDSTNIRHAERRLVVKKNRETGQLEMFTSVMVPDNPRSEAALSKTALLRRGNFSGYVYLFTPDGQFYDGIRYENGEKTGRFILQESSGTQAVTRGSEDDLECYEGCYGILFTLYERDCYYRNGELRYCGPYYVIFANLIIICPPGGPTGGGGGGPGGPDGPDGPDNPDDPDDPDDPEVCDVCKKSPCVCPPSIVLTLSGETNRVLCSHVTLVVTTKSQGLTLTSAELFIDGVSVESKSGVIRAFDFPIRMPRAIAVQVKGNFSGYSGKITSNTINIQGMFPDEDFIKQQFSGVFSELWNRSIFLCDDQFMAEFGATFYIDTREDAVERYSYTEQQSGIFPGDWSVTPEMDLNYTDMTGSHAMAGGRWAIGNAHTHPPREWMSGIPGYIDWTSVGPSQKDISSVQYGMPNFVIDYVPTWIDGATNWVPKGHPADAAYQYYNAGGSRRNSL